MRPATPNPLRVTLAGLILLATFHLPRAAGTAPGATVESAVTEGLIVKQRHSGSVTGVAFTPEGVLVSAAGPRQEVLHWSPESGALVHGCFDIPPLRSARLSPQGRRLAVAEAATDREALTLYDTRSGAEVVRMEGATRLVKEIAFSSDEAWLAAFHPYRPEVDDGQILVWNARSGKLRHSVSVGKAEVCALALSADGRRLAASVQSPQAREVRLWDLRTGQAEPALAAFGQQLTFSPDGGRLAVVSHRLTLWDLARRTPRELLGEEGPGQAGAPVFSPDGQDLAVLVHYPTRNVSLGLHLIHLERQEEPARILTGRHYSLTQPAFSPDGQWLAVGSRDEVFVWERATGKRVATFGGKEPLVRAVAFSPDGQRLASTGDDRITRLWDPLTAQLAKTIPAGFQALAFSPDGNRLGIAGEGVQLYDLRRERLHTVAEKTPGGSDGLAFSPDGKWLATGNAFAAPRIWEAATHKPGPTLDGRSGSIGFSPDGTTFVAAGLVEAGTVFQSWSTRTWTRERRVPAHRGYRPAFAFSPDGKTLVSGGDLDRTLQVWNTADWHALPLLGEQRGSIQALRYLPDGKTVAVLASDYDTEVSVWEPRTGRRMRTLLERKTEHARAMDLSPDGKRLVLGTTDGSLRLFETATGKLLVTMRPVSGSADPTSAGWVAYTPEGYFTGTPGMESALFWPVDGKLRTSPELIAKYRRPERVRATLRAM